MPKRIQLRRTKGWRLPSNCAAVARPTVFGNPWSVEEAVATKLLAPGTEAEVVVKEFRAWLLHGSDPQRLALHAKYRELAERHQRVIARLPELRGKDLACWCKIGAPCHADVLIELANRDEPTTSDEG